MFIFSQKCCPKIRLQNSRFRSRSAVSVILEREVREPHARRVRKKYHCFAVYLKMDVRVHALSFLKDEFFWRCSGILKILDRFMLNHLN